ncbi:MAG: FHA domain-containing protein [Solirubrobacteraceae bacterium]|nr:FHA domain-containing protein [Solirubrobacteraceae bacterium]
MTSTDWLVLSEADCSPRVVPIIDRLFVGRTCAGASASPHLLLDDPAISRDHFELRIDPAGVTLLDRSTNGTRVNGRRVERDEPLSLTDGDFVEVGTTRMSFRSLAAGDRISDEVRTAVRAIELAHVATVVGDVVGYTAIAERDGEDAAAAAADELFASLGELLVAHGATTSHRNGDSLFAAWDVTADPQAAGKAVGFALAAAELVEDTALQMGWGVTLGNAVPGHPSTARDAVDADAINLAFRLSAVAARDGEPRVLVAAEAAAAAPDAADFGDPREIAIRGRAAAVRVQAAE